MRLTAKGMLLWCLCWVAAPMAAAADAYEDFCRQLEEQVNQGNLAFITGNLDTPHMIERLVEAVDPPQKHLEDVRSMGQAAYDALGGYLKAVESVRCKRLLKDERLGTVALVRANLEKGDFAFWGLALHGADQGQVRIHGWRTFDTGWWMHEILADLTRLMLKPPGRAEMMATYFLNDAEPSNVIDFMSAVREENAEKAVELYQRLPPSIQDSPVVIIQYERVTRSLGDENWHTALEKVAATRDERHPAHLIAVNHFINKGEYKKAYKTLDKAEKALGPDAALDSFRASIALTAKDYRKAYRYARAAIRADRDFEGTYWHLMDALVADGKFHEAALTIGILEGRFGYSFDADELAGVDEDYNRFVASEAFQRRGG